MLEGAMGKSPEKHPKWDAANWLLLGTLILGATGVRLGIQNPEHPDTNDLAPAAETVPSPKESNIHHKEEPAIQTTPDPSSLHFFENQIEPPTAPPPGNAILPIHGSF